MERIIKSAVKLLIGAGKVTATIEIAYCDGDDAVKTRSEATLVYDGTEYRGQGNDYLLTDTLADLQMKLLEDVQLACCMTCRHGNMCPYGNTPDQLFCTKDIRITSKGDMCDLFDKTNPFEQRAVALFGYCEDFVCQSNDCYTYNDYLYQLEEKRAANR